MDNLTIELLRRTFANAEKTRVMKHHHEKYAGRRSPIDPEALAKVKRTLFKDVDYAPAPHAVFIEKELKTVQFIEKRRWDFDFSGEKPNSGSGSMYNWESSKRLRSSFSQRSRRLGQTKITDFMNKRKNIKRPAEGSTPNQKSPQNPKTLD